MRKLSWVVVLAWASVARAGGLVEGTPYGCGFVKGAGAPLPRVQQEDAATLAIRELAEVVAHPTDAAMERALLHVSALDMNKLGVHERIVLQNQLLQLDWSSRPADIAMEARAVVRWLALPAVVLDAFGSEPESGLAAYLGPREGWVERQGPRCGSAPLVHEYRNRGALAYRPMRNGKLRALVAQRVALDSLGIPHVTPLIAQVEMRSGLGNGTAACALEFDPGALAAGRPAGLRALPLAELDHPPFVVARNGAATCYGCHGNGSELPGFEDVVGAEADALLLSRRTVLLEFAARRLGWVSQANQ